MEAAGLSAHGGRVSLRGVTRLSPGERNVSVVFQSCALFPHTRVLDNVAHGFVPSERSGMALA